MENLKEQLQQLASTPELLELAILGYTVPNSSIKHTYENSESIKEAITFLPKENQLACLKTLRANTNDFTLLSLSITDSDSYKELFSQLDSDEIIYGIDKSWLSDIERLFGSSNTVYLLSEISTANKYVISEICEEYRNRKYQIENLSRIQLESCFRSMIQLISFDPNPEYKWEQRIQDVKEQIQHLPPKNNKIKDSINVWIASKYQKYLEENYKNNTNYILQELAKLNKELGIFYLPDEYKFQSVFFDIKFTPEQLAKYIHDSGIEPNDLRYQEIINEFRNNAKAFARDKYTNNSSVQQKTSDLLIYDAMQEEIGETEFLEQGHGRGH